MQRKVLDKLASGVGAGLVVILLVAGGLLVWGHSFAQSNVHSQLSQQQVYFPKQSELSAVKAQFDKGGQKAVTDPEFPNAALMVPAIEPYAGQQVLTGKEAQVYANDFIGQHLYAMPLHGVYSLVSTAVRSAKPGSKQATTFAALETAVFQGTTLRGMLLEAYAFGTIGTVMIWGAIASFVGAFLMALLVAGGILHARRTPAEERLFENFEASAPKTVVPVA
ncbi:MAG TPA: hypothetical protein VHV75_03670 [Solirubrobacteraceae bacterium]|jgi:hypothetical protein|nr:hypothetical protein [Solirubrobacteraceae bacterium]